MDEIDMNGKEWEGDFDPLADPDEKQHLLSVLDSFRSVAAREACNVITDFWEDPIAA